MRLWPRVSTFADGHKGGSGIGRCIQRRLSRCEAGLCVVKVPLADAQAGAEADD